jgi:S-adenosylmethionine:tRNA-ribosyltransferase-isomerase (queuine synthetase)
MKVNFAPIAGGVRHAHKSIHFFSELFSEIYQQHIHGLEIILHVLKWYLETQKKKK